jgi:hypothetical protein
MSREFDHQRMTADQIRAALDALNLTTVRLALLTGVRRDTIEDWCRPYHDRRAQRPPFWLSSWLALAAMPGGLDMADRVASEFLRRPGHADS